MVPHVAACETHQRSLEFSYFTRKRLLQQCPPRNGHRQPDRPCPKSANRRHVRRFAPKFCTGELLELLDRISVAEFLTSAPDAGSGLRRRLRPEVSKNSSTALSSNEGELVRSITTCAPARLRMRHVLDSENGPDTDVDLVEVRGDEGFDGLRIHVPIFAEARSIASNSVSLKRQPSASRLVLA